MKILILAVIVSISPFAGGQSLKALESGAAAWSLAGDTWKGSQIQDGPYFAGLIRGFLAGLNSSGVLQREPKSASPLFNPDEWMRDPSKAGPSILAFIRQNKPTGFKEGTEKFSGLILMAWYLANHSSAKLEDRTLSEVMAADYFNVDLENWRKESAEKAADKVKRQIEDLPKNR